MLIVHIFMLIVYICIHIHTKVNNKIHKINMSTLTFEVKTLQNQLREVGATVQMVSDESGFSRESCSKVLNGHYINPEIVTAAIRVRDRMKKEQESKVKKINRKIVGK